MRRQPGSYTIDYEHISREAEQTSQTGSHTNLAPQARVVRQFNIEDVTGNPELWNVFLNSLAQKNDESTRVRNLGHIKVTYLDTQQLGRMFSRRFPEHNNRSLLREMSGVKRDFQDFVFRSGSIVLDAMTETEHCDEIAHSKWMHGMFKISPVIEPVEGSKTRRGFRFMLDSEEVLVEEQREIVQFFKHSGFDTRNLDRGAPHLTVIEGFWPIGTVALKRSDWRTPLEASLNEPQMMVYENTPSITSE